MRLRLKLIACKAIFREVSYLSALSPNILDVTWIRQKFHSTPEVLHRVLQEEIDAVESGMDNHTNKLGDCEDGYGIREDFDAILLGYGLCSNAAIGLVAKSHRLVIPRAHDCITFCLGAKERYSKYFKEFPGCYWYTASWIENTEMPSEETQKQQYEYFQRKGYDEETIEYLLEEMQSWNKNYKNVAYIRMPFYDKPEYQEFTKEAAAYFHWDYHLLEGDMGLLGRFIAGDWDDEDFLVLEPGQKAAPSYDEGIICCG